MRLGELKMISYSAPSQSIFKRSHDRILFILNISFKLVEFTLTNFPEP